MTLVYRFPETSAGVCHYCRKDFGQLTRDHVIPRSAGGTNAYWNVVYACERCNSLKADSWPTCECEFCSRAVFRHRFALRKDE